MRSSINGIINIVGTMVVGTAFYLYIFNLWSGSVYPGDLQSVGVGTMNNHTVSAIAGTFASLAALIFFAMLYIYTAICENRTKLQNE